MGEFHLISKPSAKGLLVEFGASIRLGSSAKELDVCEDWFSIFFFLGMFGMKAVSK